MDIQGTPSHQPNMVSLTTTATIHTILVVITAVAIVTTIVFSAVVIISTPSLSSPLQFPSTRAERVAVVAVAVDINRRGWLQLFGRPFLD